MSTPNKHKDLIIEWAYGVEIEIFNTSTKRWEITSRPLWLENERYREFVDPADPLYELKVAYWNGKTIQAKSDGEWLDINFKPKWVLDEYRIKPDPYKELKEAKARGITIQVRSIDYTWLDIPAPSFDLPPDQYRIKPGQEYRYQIVLPRDLYIELANAREDNITHKPIIRLTYQNGTLIAVELWDNG